MGKHFRTTRKARRGTYDECVAAKRQAQPPSTILTSSKRSPSPGSLALAHTKTSRADSADSPYISGPDCETGDIRQHFLADRRDSAFVCALDPATPPMVTDMLGANKKSDDVKVKECALRNDHKLRQRIVWGACIGSFAFLIFVGLVMGLFFA